MARSDFAWVNFDETFSPSNTHATRLFDVEGNPFGTGYLLIQMQDVERTGHGILINDRELPSFDITVQEGNDRWTLWMDRIPNGFLHQGQNRITIRQRTGGSDNFTVANVAIHWRETG